MTRILVIDPGAETSTADVYDGLVPALRRAGAEVGEYRLSTRIARAGSWLAWNYRKARKVDPSIVRPTFADTLYLAGERALPVALALEADWVLVVSGMYVIREWLTLLRRAGLKVALLLTESPYSREEFTWAREADAVWTNERASVPMLRAACPHTRYLPHAYDPLKHRPAVAGEPLPEDVPAHDCVFVGSGFQERVELLAAVDWDNLVPGGVDLGLYGHWSNLGSRHRLRRYVRGGETPNARTAALYRRARIGLNLYRSSLGFGPHAPRLPEGAAESLNPRALELAACGTFHLSEYRKEVEEVFGFAVPTFTTAAELEALLRRLLPRPDARAGRAALLPGLVAGRTFDAMAAQVLSDLAAFRQRAGGGSMPEAAG